MNRRIGTDVPIRVALATTLAVSGYIHAYLYLNGYRFIHVIGVPFLVQTSVSFGLALLVLIGGPVYLRLGAAGAAAGALTGFALSRTVGIFGFTERGWQPSPQSLLSVVAEASTLLLLLPTLLGAARSIVRRQFESARTNGDEQLQPTGTS
ncbi:MAG: hypothetical protein M3O28_07535 [Actinomycetota bacterium]|nr:hypothetical protein [Actinomycetota bacterium]